MPYAKYQLGVGLIFSNYKNNTMDIKEQIITIEELLRGMRELNGEYQKGEWKKEINDGRKLLEYLKSVDEKSLDDIKNTDDILEVLGNTEMVFTTFRDGIITYFFHNNGVRIEILLGHNSSIPDMILKPKMLLKELRLDSVIIMKDGKTIFDNL